MRQRLDGEQGEATTEIVLTVPVLILFVFVIIQFGLWYHANELAEAAAQEGVRSARMVDGSAEDGTARATEFMTANAPSLVQNTVVSADRTDEIARVEVSGTLASIVPGLDLPVRAEAQSPTEQFREALP